MWVGPYPRVHIMNPDQLKDALCLMHDIQKRTINPLTRLLFNGLTSHEGPNGLNIEKLDININKLIVSIYKFNFVQLLVSIRLVTAQAHC